SAATTILTASSKDLAPDRARVKRPTRDTSRVGTGRESGTLGDPRAPHVAAGESRRDRRGTARPADASVAMPVQHTEGWRLHRCGGIRRSSDARRARTPHAAARQSRVVLSLHARVWLRPET